MLDKYCICLLERVSTVHGALRKLNSKPIPPRGTTTAPTWPATSRPIAGSVARCATTAAFRPWVRALAGSRDFQHMCAISGCVSALGVLVPESNLVVAMSSNKTNDFIFEKHSIHLLLNNILIWIG